MKKYLNCEVNVRGQESLCWLKDCHHSVDKIPDSLNGEVLDAVVEKLGEVESEIVFRLEDLLRKQTNLLSNKVAESIFLREENGNALASLLSLCRETAEYLGQDKLHERLLQSRVRVRDLTHLDSDGNGILAGELRLNWLAVENLLEQEIDFLAAAQEDGDVGLKNYLV